MSRYDLKELEYAALGKLEDNESGLTEKEIVQKLSISLSKAELVLKVLRMRGHVQKRGEKFFLVKREKQYAKY